MKWNEFSPSEPACMSACIMQPTKHLHHHWYYLELFPPSHHINYSTQSFKRTLLLSSDESGVHKIIEIAYD